MCDYGFIWNPSNCECKCDKSCYAGEYLDYKNCKCRKRIIPNLVEECSGNIDGNEIFYHETLDVTLLNTILLNAVPLNVYKKVSNCCTISIVLFAIFFITSICICSVFIYFDWYLKKDDVSVSLIQVVKQQFIK